MQEGEREGRIKEEGGATIKWIKKKKRRERETRISTLVQSTNGRGKKQTRKKIQGTNVCVCVYFRLCRKVRM